MPDTLMNWRAAGVLLPFTAVPSEFGVGDLGPGSHEFADFLSQAGQHFWQVLPLGPTDSEMGHSPYATASAFAGNPLLISPHLMREMGWLPEEALTKLKKMAPGPSAAADYQAAEALKKQALAWAFELAEDKIASLPAFQDFCNENSFWLNDYALFVAAKAHFSDTPWIKWPESLKNRYDSALKEYGLKLGKPILEEKFKQFIFFKQFARLKEKLRSLNLGLIGDAAIYVQHDSSDVWANQHLFKLDFEGRPTVVSGVPPDYFAKEGQLWGHPVFDWEANKREGYRWWISRLRHNFGLFDKVRLDHFRGFAQYWEVPRAAKTAIGGRWQPGPGAYLFQAVKAAAGYLPIIAEDLGFITPDVTQLRKEFGMLGIRVLQFGFGINQGNSTHAPFRIPVDNVVFVGTHDNNTTRGWYREDVDDLTKEQLSTYAGREINEQNVAWAMIRLAYLSHGALALAAMQDLLNLDEKSRFNTPGTVKNNWRWQMSGEHLKLLPQISEKLLALTVISGRDHKTYPNILHY